MQDMRMPHFLKIQHIARICEAYLLNLKKILARMHVTSMGKAIAAIDA